MLKRALPFVLLIALWPLSARADCANMPGSQIALFSSNYDPDVLVWDSRRRLLNYASNSYQIAKLLLSHAILARAGTLAVVTSCHRNDIHQRFSSRSSDVVGVRMTNGEYRGRSGWVVVDDVHIVGSHALHRHHP
ncbi:MAG: hypothetical protein JOZ59_00610 [Candidatus Eremiobacteraeota bacterium]|nr:hypothetical protein [Candidatus Eremiobacteraeota bacterium]